MRDPATIEAVLSAAEVGHRVLSTLHTTTVSSARDQLINAFPPQHKPQIVTQLVGNLQGVIAQRLIPRADGKGRVPAEEAWFHSPNSQELRQLLRH